jgi:integrase
VRRGHCSVFRRKRRGPDGKIRIARQYSAKIALPGNRPRIENTGCRDKRAAQQWAAERFRRLELEAVGLGLPKPAADASAAHLVDLVDAYVAGGGVRGNAGKPYLRQLRYTLLKFFKDAGWQRLGDVSSEVFIERRRADDHHASKTWNNLLGDLNAFVGKLVTDGKLGVNPFSRVGRDTRERRKRVRRSLTVVERDRLLAVAGDAMPVYLLATRFGLRRAELRALRPEHFERTADCWVLVLPKAITKNRKGLRAAVPFDVRCVLERLSPGPRGNYFPKALVSAERLREDLKRAGIAYRDDAGRVVDLHALRGTAATHARLHGADAFTTRNMMRHSDQRLTDEIYTDAEQLPGAQAVRCIPCWSGAESAEVKSAYRRGTPEWTLGRDGTGRFRSAGDVTSRSLSRGLEPCGQGSRPGSDVFSRDTSQEPIQRGRKESNLEPPDP